MTYNFALRVLNFILPPRESERAVELITLDELLIIKTADGLPYSDERVRALVWELKYRGNRRAARLAGAAVAEDLLAIAGEELEQPLLIPVPMHASRRRERGHNQTELLCKAALGYAPASSYRYAPGALKRIKRTPEQQKLGRGARLTNVAGSMRADPALVRSRACVVVDDVTTTGATLAEAARALKEAGAARVHTLALAQS